VSLSTHPLARNQKTIIGPTDFALHSIYVTYIETSITPDEKYELFTSLWTHSGEEPHHKRGVSI